MYAFLNGVRLIMYSGFSSWQRLDILLVFCVLITCGLKWRSFYFYLELHLLLWFKFFIGLFSLKFVFR